MMRNLQAKGIGLKDEEDFISRLGSKFKSRKKFGKRKEVLGIMMKVRNNSKEI